MKDGRDLAFIDDLTGVFNRRYLFVALEGEIKKREGEKGSFFVFIIDIDNFKNVNDKYGHIKGDGILKEAASVLQGSLREGCVFARYAGDEFAIILEGQDEKAAVSLGNKIIDDIRRHRFTIEGIAERASLTISIGISSYPIDGIEPKALIDRADKALYLSKKQGKNRASLAKELTNDVLVEASAFELFPLSRFINREREMQLLRKAMDDAAEKPYMALLSGPQGIGKTRVLSELRDYTAKKNDFSLYGTCEEELQCQPYGALVAAFEKAGVKLAGSPEDLFKEISAHISRLLASQPITILMDDLEWADRATLRLISFLLEQASPKGLFICATVTKEQDKWLNQSQEGEAATVTSDIKSLVEKGMVKEMSLTPLEQADVSEFIQAAFSNIIGLKELAELVAKKASGNPLFIEEVLRALLREGAIYYENGRWKTRRLSAVTLPDIIKDALRRRVGALDTETREVMGDAAVIGDQFSVMLLNKIVDKNPGLILDIIGRAEKAGVVRKEDLSEDEYKFISEMIRRLIYELQEESRRKGAHFKLAQEEEAARHDKLESVAGKLAFHFKKAEDSKKAALYANMAAQLFRRLPDYNAALSNFRRKDENISLVEEGPTVALSERSQELVPDLIRSIRAGVINILLYPPASEMRSYPVREAYRVLSEMFSRDEKVAISRAQDVLLVNGIALDEAKLKKATGGLFLELMGQQRIDTITVIKGASMAEISNFLECLSLKEEQLKREEGFQDLLVKKGILHIRVNQTKFDVVKGGFPAGLPFGAGYEEGFIEDEAFFGRFSQRRIEDIITLPTDEKADFIIDEYRKGLNLTNLRNLVRMLVSQEGQDGEAASSLLAEKLSELGLAEKDISWALKDNPWENAGPVTATEDFLERAPQFYLDKTVLAVVFKLMRELIAGGEDDMATKILQKILQDMRTSAPEMKPKLAVTLFNMINEMLSGNKGYLVDDALDIITRMFAEEGDAKVSDILMKTVENISLDSLAKSRYASTRNIIASLKDWQNKLQGDRADKKALIERTLSDISAPASVEQLLANLKYTLRDGADCSLIADSLLELKGEAAVKDMVALAMDHALGEDQFRSYSMRRILAKALRTKCREKAVQFIVPFLSSDDYDVLKVALELLGDVADLSAAKYINPLCNHSDPDVIRAARVAIKKIQQRES